jgi:hypothetical protein
MGRYADWTKEEVWEKADWEGGICGLMDWGGADAFEALGPDAYAAAQSIETHLRFLQRCLNEVEEGM